MSNAILGIATVILLFMTVIFLIMWAKDRKHCAKSAPCPPCPKCPPLSIGDLETYLNKRVYVPRLSTCISCIATALVKQSPDITQLVMKLDKLTDAQLNNDVIQSIINLYCPHDCLPPTLADLEAYLQKRVLNNVNPTNVNCIPCIANAMVKQTPDIQALIIKLNTLSDTQLAQVVNGFVYGYCAHVCSTSPLTPYDLEVYLQKRVLHGINPIDTNCIPCIANAMIAQTPNINDLIMNLETLSDTQLSQVVNGFVYGYCAHICSATPPLPVKTLADLEAYLQRRVFNSVNPTAISCMPCIANAMVKQNSDITLLIMELDDLSDAQLNRVVNGFGYGYCAHDCPPSSLPATINDLETYIQKRVFGIRIINLDCLQCIANEMVKLNPDVTQLLNKMKTLSDTQLTELVKPFFTNYCSQNCKTY